MTNPAKANTSERTRRQVLPGTLKLPNGTTIAWVFVSIQDSKPAFSLSYSRDLYNSYGGDWYAGGIEWEFNPTYPDNLRVTFVLLPGITSISSGSKYIALENLVQGPEGYLQPCIVSPEASHDNFSVNTGSGSHDPVIVVTPITF